ncbi:MAG: hypothetical protein OEN02_19700 [Gammaproteobacteria bacterium]|nr:hypothetical protein [Gammaproteobacteria bacterium]MDH3534784.1 hypothetical protein [Gammaproteobacteria bacterium]
MGDEDTVVLTPEEKEKILNKDVPEGENKDKDEDQGQDQGQD